MKRIISILCTDMLVVLLWVVFRSQSMNEVINFYKLSLSGIHNFTAYLTKGRQYLNPMIIADIILLLFYDIYALKNDVIMKVSQCKARWVIYICFVLWIYYQIPQIENKAFLYFQF